MGVALLECLMTIQTEAPSICQWPDGSLRVGATRLLVDVIVQEFQRGATAEQIAQSYDVASLVEVYAVIAYYLRHRDDLDAYLSGRQRQADEVRTKIQAQQGDLGDIRARLLARRPA